jgi:hypothetical protein
MSPDVAVAAILAEFPEAPTGVAPAETIEITSGGARTDRDVEPALYASRALAAANFQREALAALRGHKPAAIIFVDGPHLDNWHMTVMDSKGTQRMAEQRYSMSAKIGLVHESAAAPAAKVA